MRSPTVEEALGLRYERLSPLARAALACGLAAMWLLGRRYGGITHDATLYLAQGLRRLDPAVFDRDLFFAHGAQDAYTLFPWLYAPLIQVLDGPAAAMLLTIVGQIAFFAAAAALVAQIGPGMARWWSLALLAAVSGFYGGSGVFRFAESFATARTLAEPLVVVCLVLALRSRHGAAFVTLAAAALLHPLMAAPGFAVLYLWYAAERPRLFWLLPVLAAGALAVALLWPATTVRFDEPWREAVLIRSPHLFLAQWHWADLARYAWGFGVVALAARFLSPAVLRMVLAAVAAACIGVCATGIGVDVLDSALLAALQPWRTHWLMHLFSILLVPFAAAGLWRSGNAGRAAAACLAASCCMGRNELPAAALLVVLAAALDASERRWPGWLSDRALRPVLLGAIAVGAVGLLFEIQTRLPLDYAARLPSWTDYVNVVGSGGGLLPLALLVWLAACSRLPQAGLALALAALALAAQSWDARSVWSRIMEQAYRQGSPFQGRVVAGHSVFWPEPGGPAWLLFRTSTWFSVDQGAGMVFHRNTAIEYSARRRASLELRAAMQNCLYRDQTDCDIKAHYAQALCRRPGGPDYLVLNGRVPGQSAVEWHLPPGVGPGRKVLYLYSCGGLKEKAGSRPAIF